MGSKKVAFQGETGAYSESAILSYFGSEVEPLPFADFPSVFDALKEGRVDSAVLPLENSLAGTISQNFDLMHSRRTWTAGEIKLRVKHCLLAVPGADISAIKQVYSHPQALAQSSGLFKKYDQMEAMAFLDTAGAARMISEAKDPTKAAIASATAAKHYGLSVVEEGVEDDHTNTTRFAVLEASQPRKLLSRTKRNKTTLVYTLKNIPGALHKSLSIFAIREIDLLRIESRPVFGSPWQYRFFVDLRGDVADEPIEKAIRHLDEISNEVLVLGSFVEAENQN